MDSHVIFDGIHHRPKFIVTMDGFNLVPTVIIDTEDFIKSFPQCLLSTVGNKASCTIHQLPADGS